MANSVYLRAVNGSKTKAIDSAPEINECAQLAIPVKKALHKLAKRVGAALRVEADLTAVTSTTLATSTEFGYFDVKAGVWYEYEGFFQLTNGSGANGGEVDLFLSGTQTSMKGFGYASGAAGTADPTDATNSSISTNTIVHVEMDTTSPFTAKMTGVFKPVADAKLVIQLAEKDTGSGTLVLKEGSYLRVRVLE